MTFLKTVLLARMETLHLIHYQMMQTVNVSIQKVMDASFCEMTVCSNLWSGVLLNEINGNERVMVSSVTFVYPGLMMNASDETLTSCEMADWSTSKIEVAVMTSMQTFLQVSMRNYQTKHY